MILEYFRCCNTPLVESGTIFMFTALDLTCLFFKYFFQFLVFVKLACNRLSEHSGVCRPRPIALHLRKNVQNNFDIDCQYRFGHLQPLIVKTLRRLANYEKSNPSVKLPKNAKNGQKRPKLFTNHAVAAPLLKNKGFPPNWRMIGCCLG